MPDSDKTLNIQIVLDLLNAGKVDEAKTALQGLKKSAEELGDSENETSSKTETLELSHRELHKILHLLGNSTVPGLGRALGELAMGPIGIALAIGTAFEQVRKHIEEVNKELDEMGERAAQAFADVKANLFDAIRDEEFSTEKIDKFFAHVKEQADEAKQKIKDAFELKNAQSEAQEKVLKAQEEVEIKRAKEQFGPKPTDDQKQAIENQIEAIKSRYGQQVAQMEIDRNNAVPAESRAEMAQMQQEIQKAYDQVHALQSQALPPGVEDAIKRGAAAAKLPVPEDIPKVAGQWMEKNAEDAIKKIGDQKGADEKALDAKKKENEPKIQALQDEIGELTPSMKDSPVRKEMIDKRDKLQGEIDDAAGKVKTDNAAIESLKTSAAKLKEHAEEVSKANAALAELQTKVRALAEQIRSQEAIAGVKNQATGAVAGIQSQSAIENYAPHRDAAPLDQLETRLHYSEEARQRPYDMIMSHLYTVDQIYNSLTGTLQSQIQNSRNAISG
jgi:hypothetical protein